MRAIGSSGGTKIHTTSYTGTTIGSTSTVLVTTSTPSDIIVLGPISESGGETVFPYVTSGGYWAFRYLDKLPSNQQRTISYSYAMASDIITD